MRKVSFRKVEDYWESRPFQGWSYRIIKRWLKGYTLYFNGQHLANDTRINNLRKTAQEHLNSAYPKN
jgi:hypothetical protein